MLSVRERQIKLSFLGYYNGKIDGVEGKKTKKAYLDLQKDYFVNNSFRHDIDGLYGKNTDKLLVSLYNVKTICKHFTLKEFKCKCDNRFCCGYPAYLNANLLENAEKLRSYLNKPMIISSAIRCEKHNLRVGGTSGSRHLKGKAIDFYSNGFKELSKRKDTIDKWVTYKNSRYGYTNGYSNLQGKIGHPKSSTIGNYIHVDVI